MIYRIRSLGDIYNKEFGVIYRLRSLRYIYNKEFGEYRNRVGLRSLGDICNACERMKED